MTYRATAHRDDDWWIIEVAYIGVTQARTISEVYRMAADLVYAMTDVKGARSKSASSVGSSMRSHRSG